MTNDAYYALVILFGTIVVAYLAIIILIATLRKALWLFSGLFFLIDEFTVAPSTSVSATIRAFTS